MDAPVQKGAFDSGSVWSGKVVFQQARLEKTCFSVTRQSKAEMKELIRARLPDKRYRHSLNVAKRAVELAKRYAENTDRAEYAGLSHDICKSLSRSDQLTIIRENGIELDAITAVMPQLYHAIAASCFLYTSLGVRDVDILNAVRYHTTGRAGMSRLEEIIYLADLTSDDRDFPDIGRIRKLVDRDLREGMIYALQYEIVKMVQSKKPVCVDSLEAYNDYVAGQYEVQGGRKA